MTAHIEPIRHYEALLSEAPGSISREAITIKAGSGVLAAGTVLGKITASGKYEGFAAGNTGGSNAAAAVLMQNVDASGAADASATAIVRIAEVKKDALQWLAAVDAAGKTKAYNDLASSYIIAR